MRYNEAAAMHHHHRIQRNFACSNASPICLPCLGATLVQHALLSKCAAPTEQHQCGPLCTPAPSPLCWCDVPPTSLDVVTLCDNTDVLMLLLLHPNVPSTGNKVAMQLACPTH